MARCLPFTSVLFLACGVSGCPRCHLATQRHVWAAPGEGGPSVSWAAVAAAARWCSHGTRQWALEGLRQKWRRRRWGPANDWSTLAVLRSAAGGVGGWWSLRFWSRELRKPVYSGRGGRAGLPHKNACVMTGAAERRNALHNPNTVGAIPGLMWQPFLIYLSSFCPHSPALSVARNIPGKNGKLHFYLWLRVSSSQRRLFQRGWRSPPQPQWFIYSRRWVFFSPYLPLRYRWRFNRIRWAV